MDKDAYIKQLEAENVTLKQRVKTLEKAASAHRVNAERDTPNESSRRVQRAACRDGALLNICVTRVAVIYTVFRLHR
jgi:hypothetical protein